MGFVSLFALTALVALTSASSSSRYNLDFTANYGMNAGSCPSGADFSSAGWYIDRAYESSCFPRQVFCATEGATPTNTSQCDNGYVFTSDADMTCYDPQDSATLAACGITIDCGLTGITVTVSNDSIWGQTAAGLQFGDDTDTGVPACAINYDSSNARYRGFLSFDSSDSGPTVDACINAPTLTADSSGDGYNIVYNFKVMRYAGRSTLVTGSTEQREEDYDSETGTVITREKCFMIDAQCFYNPDGTASSSYVPSSANALDEHDDNSIDFAMNPVDCSDATNTLSVQDVYSGDQVCFQNSIVNEWHDNIRISSTKCWASSDAAGTTDVYHLSNFSATLDDTFGWACSGGAQSSSDYKEEFYFDAFRFQGSTDAERNGASNYVQTIYVHCDVNACASDDTTSRDCVPHCGGGGELVRDRKRRAAGNGGESVLSALTQTRTVQKMYVLPASERRMTLVEDKNSYSLFSDTLSMTMFAVGTVFAAIACVLFVILKRQNNQLKYRTMTQE